MKRALATVVALAAFAIASRALAHEIGLSRGEWSIAGAEVEGKLVFARRDVAFAVPTLDADRDGAISPTELDAARPALSRAFAARMSVRGDGALCPVALVEAALVEEDGLRLTLDARCPAPPRSVECDVEFFASLPFGHRHLARAAGAPEALLSRAHPRFAFAAPPPAAGVPSPIAPTPRAPGLFAMGVEHILTGYDHLAFLLGLLLAWPRAKALVLAVTAFTVGHTLSLACATLGLWIPNARLVEPAIAASIAWVAVENLRARTAGRWHLTLPFGLVHGFGFAGALRALALPVRQLPSALALFNAGVEAGQLAALLAAGPALYVARRRGWLGDRATRALNVALALLGAGWFFARVIG